ncbi:uncharacterized protein MELLADRAFT_85606 [Melampsora larici-populina 98AG31]|uniref:Uncharacterized protein n=1 Tax=Melampsora larici-populina (strain 98AG31 / pathotype 3-4-7) TaxID=747676 RepID=F4SDA3_MELLP|nr:uncharacterized protein MELLADRAFT_85606 [Melampsora larici-populina 98AG31]EGF97378.1 hypothetical protein MELLADRAFT_85606 [Melampsora larici-populina 98AG31]
MMLPSLLSLRHSTYVQYVGLVGVESTSSNARDRGMVSVRGGIATTGLSEVGSFANAILLTTKGSLDKCLKAGNIYAVTSKLIASNTPLIDHLHFDPKHVIDLGPATGPKVETLYKMIDKVSIVTHGYITHRHCFGDNGSGKPRMVLTVKSVDCDPISSSPVVWSTRHYVTEDLNEAGEVKKAQNGAEVILHGMIKDYDDIDEMWESEIVSITVVREADDVITPQVPVPIQRTPISSWNRSEFIRPNEETYYDDMILSYEGADGSVGHALNNLFGDTANGLRVEHTLKRSRD